MFPPAFRPGEVMFAWISFNATFPRENTVDEADLWYSRWQTFKDRTVGGVEGRTAELEGRSHWRVSIWRDLSEKPSPLSAHERHALCHLDLLSFP